MWPHKRVWSLKSAATLAWQTLPTNIQTLISTAVFKLTRSAHASVCSWKLKAMLSVATAAAIHTTLLPPQHAPVGCEGAFWANGCMICPIELEKRQVYLIWKLGFYRHSLLVALLSLPVVSDMVSARNFSMCMWCLLLSNSKKIELLIYLSTCYKTCETSVNESFRNY